MNWITDFKENAGYRIDENTRMIEIALAKLESYCHPESTIKEIWKRPNGVSNSIGNQLLHLCGNMTQYVIASLGEEADTRVRDVEFATSEGFSQSELLNKLYETVARVKNSIENATEEQLLKKRSVQGFSFSGMGCVLHAVEHYSYHTGQIAFWVKQLTNTPLGFYDGTDLNEKNEA